MFIKLQKLKYELMWHVNYLRIRPPKKIAWVPHDSIKIQKQIKKILIKNGIRFSIYKINLTDYNNYLKEANYASHKYYQGEYFPNFYEKTLEHYVSAKLLKIKRGDVFIDIASAGSPVHRIFNDIYGCKTYAQDIIFRKGINNGKIGGSATNMPLKKGSVGKMAMHCSFEHFESDSDIKFIKEAGRVLAAGGKLCILPLYFHTKYATQTDPGVLKSIPKFEPDSVIYCARGWNNTHGRFYDPEHFMRRIVENIGGLKLRIYEIVNAKAVDKNCYLKFAVVFCK